MAPALLSAGQGGHKQHETERKNQEHDDAGALGDAWFEKQLFTWGWGTGTVAMGITMLRIVDPRLRSNTLEQYSAATIPNTAVEITAVTFTPVLVLAGSAWAVVGIYGAIAVVGLAIPLVLLRGQRQAAKSGAA